MIGCWQSQTIKVALKNTAICHCHVSENSNCAYPDYIPTRQAFLSAITKYSSCPTRYKNSINLFVKCDRVHPQSVLFVVYFRQGVGLGETSQFYSRLGGRKPTLVSFNVRSWKEVVCNRHVHGWLSSHPAHGEQTQPVPSRAADLKHERKYPGFSKKRQTSKV